jgi:transposase
MRIVAGVDCHKATHTAVFLDALGRACHSLTFTTSPDGYREALAAAERFGCTEWGIEGAGSYGYALAVFVAASGSKVFEVPGAYTKRHRKNSSHHGKSDVNDAKAVAEVVLREEGRLSSFCPATMQRALRIRYDQRDRLVRDRTGAVNRLRSAALRLAIVDLPSDLTPFKAVRRIIALATTFRSVTLVDPATEATLDDLQDAAETIEQLGHRIKVLEKIIRSLVRPIAPELLDVHGISDVAAAGFIGHAGDLRNVRNASAFAMKSGTAPIACSSGRRESVRVNLGGDRQLNRLLHIVAMSQVRQIDHPGRRYYDRKRSEGKTHLAAMRCLKRTLATIIFYRLREASCRLETTATEWLVAA